MRPPTEKQITAIKNMRRALGVAEPWKNLPETFEAASKKIGELKATINHNLSVGGTINPRHSPLLR